MSAVVDLPDELAPKLREAAERLIAEVGEHDGDKPAGEERLPPRRCWRCGGTGPLSLHHLADGTVVFVHKGCHRRIHRRGKLRGTGRRRR